MGVGDAIANPKALDEAVAELTQLAGQKPVITKAKKSIANFKLREGMPIGCKVTLRGEHMYEFLDKLLQHFPAACPRLPRRQQQRLSTVAATTRWASRNRSFSRKSTLIKSSKVRGMDIVIVTTANTDEEAKALLAGMGMPFAEIRRTTSHGKDINEN